MELAVFLRVLGVHWVHLVHGEACRKNFFMRESDRRLILGKRLVETEQIEERIIGKVMSDGKGLTPCVHGITFAGKPLDNIGSEAFRKKARPGEKEVKQRLEHHHADKKN